MSQKDSPYPVPSTSVTFTQEIKKSRFITQLAHTNGIAQAKSFIEQVKAEHKDARHNCWAFVAGRSEDSMQWGFSDDGEPSGTAGKPILAQLTGSNVGEITAVVTRYSGGIKLGTGGLVKAYGGGVQQALELLTTHTKKITTELALCYNYDQDPLVEHLLTEFQGTSMSKDYAQKINQTIVIEVRQLTPFSTTLKNRSKGAVIITPVVR